MLNLIISLLILTSCASFESNYNKFEQSMQSAQDDMLDLEGIKLKTFFDYNKIRRDQAYDMSDSMYLVYFHDNGLHENSVEFQEIIEEYIKDKNSITIYLSNTGVDEDVRLEFITRDKDIYTLEDIWYNPSEVEQLPYKK